MSKRRRTWLLIAVALFSGVVVALAVPLAMNYSDRSDARADLDDQITRLDATEPRWRLADIEADW